MGNLYRGPSIDASYQVQVHLAKQFQRRIFRNPPIRNKYCLWWPCLLTNRDEMSNLNRRPSKDASYQISGSFGQAVSEEKIFQKSTNQKQGLPMVVMFVKGSGQNEQSLQKTFHRCFFFYLLNPSRLTITPLPKNDQLNFYLSKFSLSKNHLYHIWLHLVQHLSMNRLKCERKSTKMDRLTT